MAIKCISSLGDYINSFGGDEYSTINDALLAASQYSNAGVFEGYSSTPKEDRIYSVDGELPTTNVYAPSRKRLYEESLDRMYQNKYGMTANEFYSLPSTQRLNLSDKPLEQVSPEFDLIGGLSILKDGAKYLAQRKINKDIERTIARLSEQKLIPIENTELPIILDDVSKQASRRMGKTVYSDKYVAKIAKAKKAGFLTKYSDEEIQEAMSKGSNAIRGIKTRQVNQDGFMRDEGEGPLEYIFGQSQVNGKDREILLDSEVVKPDGKYHNALQSTVDHENAHGATFNIEPSITENEQILNHLRASTLGLTDREYDIIYEAMKYNQSIVNQRGIVGAIKAGGLESKPLSEGKSVQEYIEYLQQIQEERARAYTIEKAAEDAKMSTSDYIDNALKEFKTKLPEEEIVDGRMQVKQLNTAISNIKDFTDNYLSLPLTIATAGTIGTLSNQKALGGNLYGPEEEVKKKKDEEFYQDILGMLNLDPASPYQQQLKGPLKMLSSLTEDQFARIEPDGFDSSTKLNKNDIGDLLSVATRYLRGNELFNAGTLPDVNITPDYDSRMARVHSDKMFGQLSNSDRLKLLYNIGYTMDAHAGKNKTGKVGNLSEVEAINRLYNIYKESGSPKAFSTGKGDNLIDALLNESIYNPVLGKHRAHYLPWNNMYNINSLHDYMAELSHAAQFYNPKYADNKGEWYDVLPGDIPVNGKRGYERPSNKEYQAHSVIEPQLWKEAFNIDIPTKEYALGGPLKQNKLSDQEYYSILEKVAEKNAPIWGISPDEAYLQMLNDNTYNYRGYYNKYPNGKGNALDHWTDEFKTVYHPTFSDESIYSNKVSEFNPMGLPGGHWVQSLYMPAPWMDLSKKKFALGGNLYDNGSFLSPSGILNTPGYTVPAFTPTPIISSNNNDVIAQATTRAIQEGVKREQEKEAKATVDRGKAAVLKDGKNKSYYGNAGIAIRFFEDKGLTTEQALGMAANLMGESEMNPKAYTSAGGGSGAYGIAQWRGDRQKALKKKYGNHPTLEQQLEFVWHELNTTHKEGLRQLKASKTADDAARAALGHYEFNGGVDKAIASFNAHGQDGNAAYKSKLNWVRRLSAQPLLAKNYDDEHLIKADMDKFDNSVAGLMDYPMQPAPYTVTSQFSEPIKPMSSLSDFVYNIGNSSNDSNTADKVLEQLDNDSYWQQKQNDYLNVLNYLHETETPVVKLNIPQQITSNDVMKSLKDYLGY